MFVEKQAWLDLICSSIISQSIVGEDVHQRDALLPQTKSELSPKYPKVGHLWVATFTTANEACCRAACPSSVRLDIRDEWHWAFPSSEVQHTNASDVEACAC